MVPGWERIRAWATARRRSYSRRIRSASRRSDPRAWRASQAACQERAGSGPSCACGARNTPPTAAATSAYFAKPEKPCFTFPTYLRRGRHCGPRVETPMQRGNDHTRSGTFLHPETGRCNRQDPATAHRESTTAPLSSRDGPRPSPLPSSKEEGRSPITHHDSA